MGGLFTSLIISYDECSSSVILLLLITIENGKYKFENSIYKPVKEISIYSTPKTVLTTNILNKTGENNRLLKKFINTTNKYLDYNTISTGDYRKVDNHFSNSQRYASEKVGLCDLRLIRLEPISLLLRRIVII